MAYEREGQTDIAELRRLTALLTESNTPSGYERGAQTDLIKLSRMATASIESDPAAGGYERIGQTNIAVLRRKLSGGVVALVDGAPVSSWLDSSGSGRNATQTGSARPVFKTNILNGKPVVRFTSAGASVLNLATPILGGLPWTVIAVMKAVNATSQLRSLWGSSGPPEVNGVLLNSDGYFYSVDRLTSSRANVAPGTWHGSWHIFMGVAAGGGPFLFVDTTFVASAQNAVANSTDFVRLGGGDGDIAEAVCYDSALVTGDFNNLSQGFSDKYGLGLSVGTPVAPSSVAGLTGWWKADSLG